MTATFVYKSNDQENFIESKLFDENGTSFYGPDFNTTAYNEVKVSNTALSPTNTVALKPNKGTHPSLHFASKRKFVRYFEYLILITNNFWKI